MATHSKRFSIRWFLLFVCVQLLLLLIGIAYAFPGIWKTQVTAGFGAFSLVFLVMHLFNSLFEWGFHRYVLHVAPFSWAKQLAKDHRLHHSLTPIRLRKNEAGPGRIVLNRYPIVEGTQFEASAFPWYALLSFWALFTPLLIGVQLCLPHAPVILGGYAAITWSMVSYEVFHAVEHYPYAWWKRAVEHRHFGWLWQRVYGFHHFHHANVNVNETISGFFGLPVFDWLFGTCHFPKRLLLEGRLATADEFQVAPPRRFVRWLDSWARKREAKATSLIR